MTAQALERRELTVIVRLEVHVQLETAMKIFCSCSTEPAEDEEPNTRMCPVCLGLPGALPVLNKAAVESAVKVGRALNADIAEDTRFHRKSYYYLDLSKNFQITQYDAPIYADGTLEVSVEDTRRDVGITRVHLEEDPGSLQRKGSNIDTADYTLVSYSHTGAPLVEIVTEPNFRNPQETRAFLVRLEEVPKYLGVFDVTRNGSLRTDASISLIPADKVDDDSAISDDTLEAVNRTEVKNIPSHRGAEKALVYEIACQKNAIQRGRAVEQEARHWDESHGITVSMRSKEGERDYHYFREASLLPLQVAHWKEEIPIPELPGAHRERFRTEYGIDEEFISRFTSIKEVVDFFEDVATEFDTDLAATWVTSNPLDELSYHDMCVADVSGRLDEFTRLAKLVAADEVTTKSTEGIVPREMLDKSKDPDTIVSEAGLDKADDDEIGGFVQEAINENPNAAEDYRNGEGGALDFLVGQAIQRSQGGAGPGIVNQLPRKRLDE